MPKLYTFMVDFGGECMEKVRLDRYLAKVLGVPRSQITHLIDKKMVLVNGVVAKKSGLFVEESDRVEIVESRVGNSSLGLHSADFANLGHCADFSPVLRPKFAKNHESQTENPSVVDSALAQNLGENQAKFAESSADSAPSTNEANSTIADEFLGFCEASDKDKTKVYRGSEARQSLKSRCESKFAQIQRIYEDNDILILNKPPFLATHGAPSLKEPSLVEWLKAHKIQRSTISGELREGIVHRLDKQTSGALVVAKNNDAHNALSAQLADKTMGRLYLAIIDLPLKEDIEIECYLARNPKNRLKISKLDMRKYKKFAESSLDSTQNLPKFARYSKSKFYKLLPSKDGKKELILAKLFTGRTHQIRAHLESINRHIVGDELYGYKRGRGENERVMLHAFLLELFHPKESRVGNSPLDLHSADFANLERLAQTSSPALRPKFAKNHESQTENPSVVDSALGAESSEKNSCEAPENSPASWCKKSGEASSSVSADFLLEAEKRGSPPKSEKRQLLARRGSGAGGAALLRKESSENCGEGIAESSINSIDSALPQNLGENISSLRADSQNLHCKPPCEKNTELQGGLPRASARNDESFLDSANRKLRFIAPLFDDMKDYLAKNFDMEKVYEILHALPARTF